MAIRLKVELNYETNLHKYWYLLNSPSICYINELKVDLLQKFFTHVINDSDENLEFSRVRFDVNGYELPSWESTNILRENDLIK